MKRRAQSELNEFASTKKKVALALSDDDSHHCYLDLTFSSSLLSSKIADIPNKLKFATIIKPLFEFCFGKSDDSVWEESWEKRKIPDGKLISIDWKRDKTYIYDQIFDLPRNRLATFCTVFNLWKNRVFMLEFIEHYYFLDKELLIKKLTHFKNDRELLIALLREDGSQLSLEIFDDWRNDFELVKVGIQEFGRALEFASDELKNNKEIVMNAVKQDGYALKYAFDELRNNREIVLTAVSSSGRALEFAAKELRNDIEIFTVAVKQNGSALVFTSEELKNNKDNILLALKTNTDVYGHISEEMKLDIDIMEKAFTKYSSTCYIPTVSGNDRERLLIISKYNAGIVMELASTELKNDREFALQLVRNKLANFRLLSKELRNDKDFAIRAIEIGSFNFHTDLVSFSYLSKRLQKDREIIKLLAMQRDGTIHGDEFCDDEEIAALVLKNSQFALNTISKRLRNDKEFLSKSMVNRGYVNLPNSLIHDRDILLKSIQISPYNINFAPTKFKHDRDFVLECVTNNGRVLEYISKEFQADREIVMAAVTQNGNSMQFGAEEFFDDEEILIQSFGTFDPFKTHERISKRLREDKQFILQIVKQNVDFSQFPRKWRCDRDIVLKYLESKPFIYGISVLSSKLLVNDRAIAMRLLKVQGILLRDMCFKHRNDREIVITAIKENRDAISYASFELRNDPQILELYNSELDYVTKIQIKCGKFQ